METAPDATRSEEHTSELQSRFGMSYAVFCFKHNLAHAIPTPTPVPAAESTGSPARRARDHAGGLLRRLLPRVLPDAHLVASFFFYEHTAPPCDSFPPPPPPSGRR